MPGSLKKLFLLGTSLAAAGLSAGQAAAQEAEDSIIVTATRRAQALQDVPVAITAVNQEGLEQANVVSTADLMRIAPTLQIQSTNSETAGSTIRIRGVGTTGNNVGLEGAVGVFIDGVYRQRAGLAMNNLFDIGRIEVLRGPQGTLFGKNTSAGAITVTPNAPQLGELDAQAKIGFGNYENKELDGMVNLPIADSLAMRISGAYQEREGFIKDIRSGADGQNRDRLLMRGQLLWEPTNNISWRGTVDYSEKNETCCMAIYSAVGAATTRANTLVGVTTVPPKTAYQAINTPTRPFVETTEDIGYASNLTIDLPGDITFKNILAYRKFENTGDVDADFGPADLLYQQIDGEQTLKSAEATLNGSVGVLDWLVGAYYAEETVDSVVQSRYGADLGAFFASSPGAAASIATLYPVNGGVQDSAFAQDGSSWSVFTHNQFQFTDRFGAVLGVRYNHEEKDGGMFRYTSNSPSCGGGPFHGQGAPAPATAPGSSVPIAAGQRLLCPRPTSNTSIDENETTGTAGLNWRFTDDVLGYVSYSRGYKAGGINLDRDAAGAVLGSVPTSGLINATQAQVNNATRFNPEFSDSYELGLRTQFFDRTLTANFTYFQTDYEDFQLNTFNGISFAILNAGTVESKGFELEGNWRAGEELTFTYGVAHVVAKYGFERLLRLDPPDAAAPAGVNPPLAGRTLTNSPKWALSSGVHYEHPISGDINVFFDLSGSYRTSINTGSNLNALKIQEALSLFNARVGLFDDGENGWEVALWGNNLTDEYYTVVTFDNFAQSGSLSDYAGAPRMYGVTFKKNF